MPDDAQQAARTRVFLSYSRKDEAFTRRLAAALADRGYTPDYDQSARDPANVDTGISAEDEWWQRLKDMIAAADVMVFIVSPDSAASKVCDEEIAYARALGKRVVPILRRPVDFSKVPPRLSAINVKIDFTDDSEAAFAAALDLLCAALDLDVAWHRESVRLTLLAVRWEKAGRTDDLLLSAADVRAVGTLLERRPAGGPEPSSLLVGLRDASHAKLDAEETRQRRIIGRAFVKPVMEALKEGKSDHALRLAAAGALLAKDLGFDPKVDAQLWGPAAGAIFQCRTRAVLKGHLGGVAAAAFSPDGQRIVTASYDKSARLWDAATGKEIAALQGHTKAVNSAAFSPDDRRIVTAGDTSVLVWDAVTGKQLTALQCPAVVESAAFSPDGRWIVAGAYDTNARIWDAATGQQRAVLRSHTGAAVLTAAFSPDGLRIVTTSGDDSVRLWDAAAGEQIAALEHTQAVNSATFSPDGLRILTASDDNSARLWDAAMGEQTAALEGHTDIVWSAVFSPDGRRIVTASADNSARVWDAAIGEQIAALQGHTDIVWSAVFSPDGRRIVTASADNSARLWDAATGQQIAALQGHTEAVNSAAFSPDGQWIWRSALMAGRSSPRLEIAHAFGLRQLGSRSPPCIP